MDPYALTWDSVPVLRRRVAGVALLALLVLVVVPLLLSGREASAAAPAPSVGIGDAWVVEPSAGTTASADFALRLNRPAAGSESVQWAASSGTAGTSDFVVGSGTVTFPAGSKQQSISVTVTGDDRPEPNETFRVTLSAPVGLVLGDATGTGTIASDEGPRRLAVGDVSVLEGAAGTTKTAVFPITASSPVLPNEVVTVAFATANGTATGGSDYNGRAGTLTLPAGTSSGTVAVTVRGDATAEATERFTLNLTSPVGAVLADPSAVGDIRNDDGSVAAAPPVALSVDDAWVVEGAPGGSSAAQFRVSLPVAAGGVVNAHWATAFGTAGSADLPSASGTVSLPAGARTATVAVPVTGDGVSEGNETFRLTLSAPVGAVLADTSALGTIADDEGALTASVGDASVTEGNSGTATLSFPVDLSAAVTPGQPVSLHYATSNGSATAGSDYTAASGTIAVPGGSSSATISVPVTGDTAVEGDETVTVTLSALVGVVAADATGTGTIVNDDVSNTPVLVALSGASAAETAGIAPVTLSFSRAVPAAGVLHWSTRDGTATAGVDYEAVTDQTVAVPAGATELSLGVPLLDDTEAEPTETLFVSVAAASGFSIGQPDAMVAILDDENPLPATTTRAVAVGDIACAPTDPSYNGGNGTGNLCRQKATSDVAVALHPEAVLGLGDLQYENGELDNFRNSYNPTWGRLKSVTFPAPGNHEYYSSGAPGYYGYFVASEGGSEGGTVDPWYAVDIGSWRAIALNSNCGSVGGCGVGSPQETWLRAELAAHPARCTVAFWHAPRFSSGPHGDNTAFDAFWQDLTAAGADLVLTGHDHTYERYAPMNAFGNASATGMREFVSGLGGRSISNFPRTPRPTSQVRSAAHPGVLDLTLRLDGYDWQERPIADQTVPNDAGSSACR